MGKEAKKTLRSIAVLVGSVLFLQVAELLFNINGIELRTAAQGVKGLYVWLVAPFLLLVECYRLLIAKLKGRVEKSLSILLFAALVVILLGGGFFRGIRYLFSDELVEETVLGDGVIEGKYSRGLEPMQTRYYEPVFGIFRRTFSGRGQEEIIAKLRQRYGVNAEPLGGGVADEDTGGTEDVSSGEKMPSYIYRALVGDLGKEYLYFQVQNNYNLTDTFLYRLMQRDAAAFWGGRRGISFYNRDTKSYYGSYEALWSKEEYAGDEDLLVVWCYGGVDVTSCAGDITNWIYYALGDGRYGAPETGSELPLPLLALYIAVGEERLPFYIPGDTVWKDTNTWGENRDKIEDAIRANASYAGISLDGSDVGSEGRQQSDAAEAQGDSADFIAQYDGRYEKECELPGGAIKFRMLVLDAAAGSRAYGLIQSTDAGESWEVVSLDPFAGQLGVGVDFTFLDENMGFATLAHNGGDEGDLYVTEDGGRSYVPVSFQDVNVTLDNGYRYDPYDFPQMPYEQDGKLYVYCGQGADGDYAGGDAAGMALYESVDGGHTFTYVGTK